MSRQKQNWCRIIDSKKEIEDKDILVKNLCLNKTVLDVGCVGQDIDYSNVNWLHHKVRKVARNILGVDINHEEIKQLKAAGYAVIHADELSHINNKFDVVLILDVIEHVNNPVKLLTDYSKFLEPSGRLVITTPNSNRVRNFLSILFSNAYPLNLEHTFWFCPKTLLEIIERTGILSVESFFWLKYYGSKQKNSVKNAIFDFIETALFRYRTNFAPGFMFVLNKK